MVILAAVALIVGIGCLLLGRYAQNRGKQLTEWPSYSVGIIGVMVSILALANLSPATNTGPSPGPSAPPNAPTTPGPSTPVDTPTTPGPSTPTNTPPPQTEYYLSDYDPIQTYGINVDTTPHKVNGVMYYHPVAWAASISADKPYWAEWDVSRGCDWFESPAVGIGDKAPSGAQYVFSVSTDGSGTWDQPVSIGESYPVKISIQGVLRLRLSVAGLKLGGYGPQATWGDAKLSCSSEPPNRKK